MAVNIRASMLMVAASLSLTVASAKAQTTCTITDPTKTPTETWIALNNQTVTFSFTGGFSHHRILIYDAAGTNYFDKVYFTHSASPNTNNLAVPKVTKGSTVACRVEVTLYDTMNQVVADDTTDVNIYTN